jgi:ribosome-associated protein
MPRGHGRQRAVPKKLLGLIEKSLDDDKAEDVVVIDLAGKSSIADFMVIASGRSQRQLGAMARHVGEKLNAAGIKGIGVEGMKQGDWVLIDGGDVVVHLFRPDVRRFYNLEKMWGIELPESGREAALA